MVQNSARTTNGGEGSSASPSASTIATTLDDVMRAPAVIAPDVVVLDTTHREKERGKGLNPKEDLWLTSADGNILLKAEYFKRALCGQFSESDAQAIDLPEEDPAIFHFIVAFLYEDKYVPILPVATVLTEDEKGKGVHRYQEEDESAASESDSSAGLSDSSTARSRRHRERRRRNEDRHWERARQKHPGAHRLGCACRYCLAPNGPPCWNCTAPRLLQPPPPPGYPIVVHPPRLGLDARRRADRRRAMSPPPPPLPPPRAAAPGPAGATGAFGNPSRTAAAAAAAAADTDNINSNNNNNGNGNGNGGGGGGGGNNDGDDENDGSNSNGNNGGERISGQEDLRTWLLAYELNVDVYICANKFLLDRFKELVARSCVDMLETAGPDAAQVGVLRLCLRLYEGLPESDRLLRMVFARVGFLQSHLFRRAPRETLEFLHAHPEVSALFLREMGARREADHGPSQLPAMERPVVPLPPHLDHHYHRPLPMARPARW